ncbi:hypothetical protein AZH53_08830 [Methanomicrobiaceae archaeon CYW5]|uniref:YIP1 family protein n=1 Tax=Methanovulcanius yangii TaxID=1789227 RepID=UPI0029CA1017|nr:YIP1 family protein [Methanovulcanius yangii]MBT8508509.1 hypothetical protein [Methanovulcanius yangii]
MLLVLVQEDGSEPVEVALSAIHALSATSTGDGTPSITLNVTSPNGKRGAMVLSFIGGGGIPARDERSRIRQAIGDAVAAVRAAPSGAAIPDAGGPVAGPPGSAAHSRVKLTAGHILVKKREYIAELTADLLLLKTPDEPDAPPLTVSRDTIVGGAAENTPAGDPVLRLNVRTTEGSVRSMILVFSEWYGGGRGPERDRWLAVMTGGTAPPAMHEQSRPAPGHGPTPESLGKTGGRGELPPSDRGACTGGSPEAPSPSFCMECGEALPGTVRFCPHCGSSQKPGSMGRMVAGSGYRSDREGRHEPPRRGAKRHSRAPKRKLSFRFKSQEGGTISRVSVVEKVFGFLLAPEDAFSHTRSENVSDGVVHLVMMMGLFAVVQGAALFLIGSSLDAGVYPVTAGIAADTTSLLITMGELALGGIIITILEAFLVFIVLRLTGYADVPGETVRTCCYAATPFGTIGLLPIIGPLLALLWTIFLQFRGVQTVHETPAGIAAAAVILPGIIAAGLFWLLVLGGGGDAAAVTEGTP